MKSSSSLLQTIQIIFNALLLLAATVALSTLAAPNPMKLDFSASLPVIFPTTTLSSSSSSSSSITSTSLEAQIAILAVRKASALCQRVHAALVADRDAAVKVDKSPVTIADFGGQAIINAVIRHYFPEDIVVGEEESKDLASNPALFTQVLKVLEEENLRFTPKELLEVIDFGKRGNSGDDHAGAGKGRFWTIDPVDGTKGFLRGGQYAVGVALIEDGEVQLGVVGAPNLACKETSTGCLFYATKGGGAFEEPLDMSSPASQIAVSGKIDPSQVKFSESFDASHSSQTDTQRIAASLGITAEPVRMDSMCKYMMVARGDAEIFIRLPVKGVDYIEKIWDHAAGTLIVQESGGIVTDMHGNKLDFEQGRLLSKNDGIVATNSLSLHQIILDEIHRLE